MKGILKKVLLGAVVVAHVGLAINEVLVICFMSRLQYGTHINGIDVGGWKVKGVEEMLEEKGEDYTLLIKERGGKEEKLLGKAIDFSYDIENQIKAIKKEQFPYWWLMGLWSDREYEIELGESFDESLLEEEVKKLECLKEENAIKPENAGIELVGGKYEIIEGNPGSLVKQDVLMTAVKDAIDNGQTELTLEESKCYEMPKVTVDSQALKNKRDALNHYVASIITYDFGDRKEVLDGEMISGWITEDENGEFNLDKELIKAYVETLAQKYDTIYGVRSFKTSVGSTVSVSGGDYGWQIDKQGEVDALVELLNQGTQNVTRKPVYAQEGYTRNVDDIGNSYVEINLTRQYLWFYKDGKLVTEGSIVSGTGSNSHATPAGTYKLDYKQANAVLKGPGYACPVSYWMPFNGGIGIHDATWRGAFGGSIYVYNGSHGCINTPLNMAKTIFGQIEEGMPIICYHDVV